jgi:hypothetical protein
MTTICTICGHRVLTGQSTHGVCGGYLPVSLREYVIWAVAHIERQLRPTRAPNNKIVRHARTPEQLRANMRPEYQGRVFEQALKLLYNADRIAYDNGKIRLQTPRRRTQHRDTGEGLFPEPRRAIKKK